MLWFIIWPDAAISEVIRMANAPASVSDGAPRSAAFWGNAQWTSGGITWSLAGVTRWWGIRCHTRQCIAVNLEVRMAPACLFWGRRVLRFFILLRTRPVKSLHHHCFKQPCAAMGYTVGACWGRLLLRC
ncbi:hypothetical protein KCP69_19550 [Salmonella enterica subsp. enterica]|nr:hypothetical protein KCP69_19550 [Salmonella enterica subsp. enterica]